MNKSTRISAKPLLFQAMLVLAVACLTTLVAWPFLPRLRQEIGYIHRVWQEVRKGKNGPLPGDAAAIAEKLAPPRQTPVPVERADASVAMDPRPDDPVLSEARKRAREDPEAALDWLQRQSSGSIRLRGMLEVVAIWAAEDSASALLWLESNAGGIARLETLQSGVETWGESNPAGAAQWIDGMTNDGSKAMTAKSLAAKWARSEPLAAGKWVSGLPAGPIREEAKKALVESWLRQDAKAASAWVLSEAERSGDSGLLDKTIREFSRQSPEMAEAFIREMPAGDCRQIALDAHIAGRAEEDPAGTARWLVRMQSDDPLYSEEACKSVLYVWAENGSVAASEWLSQQPQGARRDAAVHGFSESIQRFDPEAAATWANAIGDPDRRLMRLSESVLVWSHSEPSAALEWVKSSNLEPATRAHLAEQIGAD
jgi:hypothetical protein